MTLRKKILWDSKNVSLVELSDLPIRGSEIVPVNQHTSVNAELADLLGARVCGPSCVAMVLQVFGKYPSDKSFGNIEWLLAKVSKMHKSSGKMIKFTMNVDNEEVRIPVDLYSDSNKNLLKDGRFVITEESDEYQPIFGMVRGWDHRGSARLFEIYGLMAGYWEKFGIDELVEKLKHGGVVILSVIPRRLSAVFHFTSEVGSKPAHLVLVTDVLEINGKQYFSIIDPDYDISEGVMPRYLIDREQLNKISNWRGTWVMEK